MLWISAIANELVSLLNAIGLMLNISPVILGLTILAWGNSLGDIVADVSLAIQGYRQWRWAVCSLVGERGRAEA